MSSKRDDGRSTSSYFMYIAKSVVQSRIERMRLGERLPPPRAAVSHHKRFADHDFLGIDAHTVCSVTVQTHWQSPHKLTNMLVGLDLNGDWEVSHLMKQSISSLFLIVVRVEAVCVAVMFHAQRLQSPRSRAELSMVVFVCIQQGCFQRSLILQ